MASRMLEKKVNRLDREAGDGKVPRLEAEVRMLQNLLRRCSERIERLESHLEIKSEPLEPPFQVQASISLTKEASLKMSPSSSAKQEVEMAHLHTDVFRSMESDPTSGLPPVTSDTSGSFESFTGLKDDACGLPASAYEAVILLSHDDIKLSGRRQIKAAWLVSITVQALMYMAFSILALHTKEAWAKPEDARNWRNGDAHRWVWANFNDGFSMARRVCDGDDSLSASYEQKVTVAVVSTYMEQAGILPFGIFLSMCVMVSWSMQAISELADIVPFPVYIFNVPAGECLFNTEGNEIQIHSLDRRSKLLAICSSAIHIAMYFCIWAIGCVYIARTHEVENIVVNGLSMIIVLDFDKVAFKFMTGLNVQRKCEQLRFTGFRVIPWIRLFVLAMLMGLLCFREFPNKCAQFKEYLNEACGGDLDFVIALSANSGTYHLSAARDTEEQAKWNDRQASLVQAAVWKKSGFEESFVLVPLRNMEEQIYRSLDKTFSLGRACVRKAELNPGLIHPAHLQTLRWETGIADGTECIDFVKGGKCNVPKNRMLRHICADKCGCDSFVFTGLFTREGCPKTCGIAWKHQALVDAGYFGLHGCVDWLGHPQVTRGKVGGYQRTYVRNLEEYWNASQSGAFHRTGLQMIIPDLHRLKCPDWTRYLAENVSVSKNTEVSTSEEVVKLAALYAQIKNKFCSLSMFAAWCAKSCGCQVCDNKRALMRLGCRTDCHPECSPRSQRLKQWT